MKLQANFRRERLVTIVACHYFRVGLRFLALPLKLFDITVEKFTGEL